MVSLHFAVFSVAFVAALAGAHLTPEPTNPGQWCGDQGCPPVVYFPCYWGSVLEIRFTHGYQHHYPSYCPTAGPGRDFIRFPDDFATFLPYYEGSGLMSSECAYYALRLVYDEDDEEFRSPHGIEVKSPDAGKSLATSWDSVYPLILGNFLDTFQSWGYTPGENLIGLGWDWRYSPETLAADHDWNHHVTKIIEDTYHKNHNQRVHLMAHSNGPPTVLAFMNSKSRQWREKYLASFYSLSGNFEGQRNCVELIAFYAPDEWTRLLYLSYDSWAWSMPDVVFYKDMNYFWTPEAFYTVGNVTQLMQINAARVPEYTFFDDLWKYYSVGSRTHYPSGLDIHCIYGVGIDVCVAYMLNSDDMTQFSSYVDCELDHNTDYNQDYVDNASCNNFQAPCEASGHHFDLATFPNLQHMNEPSDPNVLSHIGTTLQTYCRGNCGLHH